MKDLENDSKVYVALTNEDLEKINLQDLKYVTLEFDGGKVHVSLDEGGVNFNVNFERDHVVWKTNATNSITALKI